MSLSTFSSDGTRLRYRAFGGGPRAVVLVHGWMVSGAVWNDLLEAWQPEGVRLLVPDLRGAGSSEPSRSDYALARYAEDVIAVMTAAGVDRAVVAGHSMGGQIAQLVAATAPKRVEGLVLVCPVPAGGLVLPKEAHELFLHSGGNPAAQAKILELAAPKLSAPSRARLLEDAGRLSPEAIARSFEAWSVGGFAGRLGALRTPTLVVGSEDAFLPPQLLQETVVRPIFGARLVCLAGAHHYVPNERPAELAGLLEAFLAGVAP